MHQIRNAAESGKDTPYCGPKTITTAQGIACQRWLFLNCVRFLNLFSLVQGQGWMGQARQGIIKGAEHTELCCPRPFLRSSGLGRHRRGSRRVRRLLGDLPGEPLFGIFAAAAAAAAATVVVPAVEVAVAFVAVVG